MNLMESIRLAMRSIRANKLRSVLTMLGIIIGISAVITITTIGNSMQKTIAATLSSFGGTNLIYASLQAEPPAGESWDTWVYPEMTEKTAFSQNDLKNLKKAFPDQIAEVVATNSLSGGTVEGKKHDGFVSIQGTTPGWLASMNLKLIRGREISESDNEQAKATAIVSDLFVKYALDGKDPIGEKIDIISDSGAVYKVYVVGVYKYDHKIFGTRGQQGPEYRISTPVVVPYTYVANHMEGANYDFLSYFQILTTKDTNPTALARQVETYFNDGKYANTDWHLMCMDMASELGIINTVLTAITVAISVIAAISLVVGGVGVMNIMLVSVVERTKEIGIRKALGAKNGNIYLQFLTEAVVICVIGGILGILIGMLNGLILAKVATMLVAQFASDVSAYLTVTISPSVPAIIISVIFSILTGIVFGIYPARRAARMSPIDALRYE